MTEEVLNALKVIKAECEKQDSCEDCPLTDDDGDCGITAYSPFNWFLEKRVVREVYF